MPDTRRNRAMGSPSRRREQQQSDRSHRHTHWHPTRRRSNPSSSRVTGHPHRRPTPAIHDAGNTRQTIGGTEGSGNDVVQANNDVRQGQATVRPFDGAIGFHVGGDGEAQLREGPSQPCPHLPVNPQQMFNTKEPANESANMGNSHAGHYYEEVGTLLSMIPSQGSASVNSYTTAPETAYRHVGWYPDIQQEFMHGQSPWSVYATISRGPGIGGPGIGGTGAGTIEEGKLAQEIYSCELSLDEDDENHQVG